MKTSLLVVGVVFALLAWPAGHAQLRDGDRSVDWWAVNGEFNERDQSLTLGTGQHTLATRVGWLCLISQESENHLRQVTCSLEEKSVSFSVHCDFGRDEDHTQLWFFEGTGASRHQDFVDVGCRVRTR